MGINIRQKGAFGELDMHNELGYFCDDDGEPAPYWEVYPVDGDTGRADLNDTDELIRLIGEQR